MAPSARGPAASRRRRIAATALAVAAISGIVRSDNATASSTSALAAGQLSAIGIERAALVRRSIDASDTQEPRMQVRAIAADGSSVSSGIEYDIYEFNPDASDNAPARLIGAADAAMGSTSAVVALPAPASMRSAASDGATFVMVMARSYGRVGFSPMTIYPASATQWAAAPRDTDASPANGFVGVAAAIAPAEIDVTLTDLPLGAQLSDVSPSGIRAAPRGGVTGFPAPYTFLYDRSTTSHNDLWTDILRFKSNGQTVTSFAYTQSNVTAETAGYSLTSSTAGFVTSGQTVNSKSWTEGNPGLPAGQPYRLRIRGDYRTKKWECVPDDPTKAPYFIWERYTYQWDAGQSTTVTTSSHPPSCSSYLNWGAPLSYKKKDVSSEKSATFGISISGFSQTSKTSHSTASWIQFQENGGTVGGGVCSNWVTADYVNVY